MDAYRVIISFFVLFSFSARFARAGGPIFWELNSRAELLRGEAHGVSIDDTGTLLLAPRIQNLFDTGQSYVWSSAFDNSGNIYLGTGHDGRIFRVTPDGRGALFYKVPELDVTALVATSDGTLYAGSSPDGKVYLIDQSGHGHVFFDPPEKYIWALALMADGSLAVGTGDGGKLYRVRSANAKPESSLLMAVNQTNVISLAVDRAGNLIAGTDPGGVVLRISPEGRAFALYNAPLREIHALTVSPDGSIYFLALSEAASSHAPVTAPSPQAANPQGAQGTVVVTATVTTEEVNPVLAGQQQATPARSRNDLTNARSAVFHILPEGGTDVLWSSTSITAFSLTTARGGGVLIGTGEKGRIYWITNEARDTLLLQSDQDQVALLMRRGDQITAATSNSGKLFRFTSEKTSEGTYESPVRDAKLASAWGRISWHGAGQVELQTRSGNTERPDVTWSPWSDSYHDPLGNSITSPRARFIQWRATLHGQKTGDRSLAQKQDSADAPEVSIENVSIAYLQRNVAPEILGITVLPVGVALLPAIQVVQEPTAEANGLDPALIGPVPQIPPRRIFQRNAIALQWQAEDRNGDTMEYSVYYRALNESTSHLLKDKLRDNFYTIDGAALGDGRYLFKIVASDAPDNPADRALTGERLTEPVEIDITPPAVRPLGTPDVRGTAVKARFEATDRGGILKRAEMSVDGNGWRPIFPEDSISDSPRETYLVEASVQGPGEHTIALRVFDNSGNIGSARVVVRVPH